MSQLNVGTLASNGGPTQTIALLPGSAAIDAGDAAVCAAAPVSGLDQRGVARPFGSGCDVGAYEYTGSAPTVTITPASYSVDEQAVLNLHGTGISVDDADGDPLTVTVSAADAGAEFTANVGATGVVIVSGDGTNTLQLSGSIAQLNDFFAGSSGAALTFLLDDDTPVNSLTMTVTADDGNYSGNDTAEIDMIQVNDAPLNTIPGGQTTNEDAVLVFDAGNSNAISINDADVASGSLEVTLTVTNGTLTLAGITGLSFTTGDGTADASLVFTGSLADINNALATLIFNPSANYNGAAVLSLTSSDRGFSGTGGVLTDTDTVNITIHAVNDAPFVANPIPNQTANEDAAFNFQFAANTFNDLDIGGALIYSAQLAGGGALPGWLSFDPATRTFSGTPTNHDVGIITLRVTANDGAQTVSDNFDLLVINTNDPPMLDIPIPDQNAFDAFPFNYQFPVNTFSDPDLGDILTYSTQLAGGGALPAWLSFDPATRTLSGTPTSADIGSVVVDVIADDSNGGIVTDTFNIVVANAGGAPFVANPIPNQTANEDAAFNFQFAATTFNDPEGDALTYSAQLAGGGALPAWLSFDPATRTFSGTPANGDVGTITLQATATDGAQTVSDNFDLMVINTNDPPVTDSLIPDQNAFMSFAFNYQFPANTFSDPDVGDTLTYSAQLAGGGALPAWLSFDPATRTFSGIPISLGAVSIDVIADDGNGGVVTDTFNIVVANVNSAPFVANPIPDRSATEDAAFNFQFAANTFSDPDVGDTLTYSARLAGGGVLPAWLSFDPVTRTFSGTPANSDVGTISIDVVADDGNGGAVTDTFSIVVFDKDNPAVTRVNVTNLDGTYTIGDNIFVTLTFDQNVTVDTSGGNPTILLETGAIDSSASYASGSDSNTLTFTYTVQPGDQTPDLDYASITALLLNGASIRSASNLDALLTLPAPGGANSIAGQHAIVITSLTFTVASSTLQAVYSDPGPGFFAITFSEDVNNSGGGSGADDVTNPANYLLVEADANGIFDTVSCISGFDPNDTLVSIAGVTYVPNTAVVSLSAALPAGRYRLFVCGTTSIVDLAGLPLSGDGVTSGTDYLFDFVVNPDVVVPSAPADVEATTASSLPKTGFAPNKITTLPPQPATLDYAKLGDIVLEIPSLNVRSIIVGVPESNGEWDVTWLNNDTGWLNGTAFPTWQGNSVLTAHVTNASGLDGPFAMLKSLQYGDQVIVHIGGAQYIYEVRNTRLVLPYAVNFAFESLPDHSHLTLITCQGYNLLNESYLFRRVVRAVLVEVK